jgi:hypothetical protein
MGAKHKKFIYGLTLFIFLFGISHSFLPHETDQHQIVCGVCKVLLSGIACGQVLRPVIDTLLPLSERGILISQVSCYSFSDLSNSHKRAPPYGF